MYDNTVKKDGGIQGFDIYGSKIECEVDCKELKIRIVNPKAITRQSINQSANNGVK